MTKHYNRKTEEVKRKKLRQNSTYTEKIVWMNLRNRRMLGYKFERQYSVDKYIIDFYCPELKFAIEVDGISHHSVVKHIYDKERQKYLESYGIRFIRITDEELVGNTNKAFDRIENAMKELSKPPSPLQGEGTKG